MTSPELDTRLMYPAEKLDAARRALMLPHPMGEAQSLVAAFQECSIGLSNVRDDMLDDDSRHWVRIIRETMDSSDIDITDETRKTGTAIVRAKQLSTDEKQEFASAVDELAHWFHHRVFG